MNEIALSIIKDFLMDYEEPNYYHRRRKQFKKQTYLVWACQELIRLIEDNKDENPIELIESFAKKMVIFSQKNGTDDNPFEEALYVARNVLDTLYAAM